MSLVPVCVRVCCIMCSKWLCDVQVLNEASVEDNLIDLGPGSPAVVTPRASAAATPTPPSSLTNAAAAASAAAATAPSLATQLAGLSKTHTVTTYYCSQLWMDLGRHIHMHMLKFTCKHMHVHPQTMTTTSKTSLDLDNQGWLIISSCSRWVQLITSQHMLFYIHAVLGLKNNSPGLFFTIFYL